MDNKGQMGFSIMIGLLLVLFIVYIILAAFVEPFKQNLDNVRGSTSLNCPGTPTFNQTDYDVDDTHDKLRKRTVCFVTGISMVYFILSVLLAYLVWIYNKVFIR